MRYRIKVKPPSTHFASGRSFVQCTVTSSRCAKCFSIWFAKTQACCKSSLCVRTFGTVRSSSIRPSSLVPSQRSVLPSGLRPCALRNWVSSHCEMLDLQRKARKILVSPFGEKSGPGGKTTCAEVRGIVSTEVLIGVDPS